MRFRNSVLPGALLALLAGAACDGGSPETDPLAPQTRTDALWGHHDDADDDGWSGQAPEDDGGLHFLPPLAGPVWHLGFSAGDAPVSVRVEAADGTIVAQFDRADLRAFPILGLYRVNWKTSRSDVGQFTIVVSTPARDVGAVDVELVSGPARGPSRRAGATIPIRFRLELPAVDLDGDGVRDWDDACPALADEDPLDADCDGAVDGQPGAGGAGGSDEGAGGAGGGGGTDEGAGGSGGTDEGAGGTGGTDVGAGGTGGDPTPAAVRITVPGEAYGHHGSCAGWNGCGDAETCALWACQVNGFSTLVSYGASGPCTGFDVCHLLDGNSSVQMDWGNFCDVLGVSEIDCAP
jgi:hypothetical protein